MNLIPRGFKRPARTGPDDRLASTVLDYSRVSTGLDDRLAHFGLTTQRTWF